MKMDRLDKILSGTGFYSRSEARAAIAAGRVTVDGVPVRKPEVKVSRSAELRVGGEVLDGAEYVYYMMNKPGGYVSASKPEGDLPAVTELLPEHLRRRGLQCVGRLDADVTGLLLLTDDGDFLHRVTTPRAELPRRYEVRVDGPLTEEHVQALRQGVELRSGVSYRPAVLEPESSDPCLAVVTVTEGKYHEVKNLMAFCGRRVIAMRRLSVGGLALDKDLGPGEIRPLTEEELAGFR